MDRPLFTVLCHVEESPRVTLMSAVLLLKSPEEDRWL